MMVLDWDADILEFGNDLAADVKITICRRNCVVSAMQRQLNASGFLPEFQTAESESKE